MKRPYFYCRQQNKDLDDGEKCLFEQGTVEDPSKVCAACDHYKAIAYKELIILQQKGNERFKAGGAVLLKSSKPPKKKTKKVPKGSIRDRKRTEFSSLLKKNAPYPQSHILDHLDTSGIQLLLPDIRNPGAFVPWPVEHYLQGKEDSSPYPFRLIDAIDDNSLRIKVSLDHNQTSIRRVFEKLLTLASAELEKRGGERFKMSARKFDKYIKVYRLMQKNWTDYKIAKKLYPSENPSEAAKNVKHIRTEIKKLINPE